MPPDALDRITRLEMQMLNAQEQRQEMREAIDRIESRLQAVEKHMYIGMGVLAALQVIAGFLAR